MNVITIISFLAIGFLVDSSGVIATEHVAITSSPPISQIQQINSPEQLINDIGSLVENMGTVTEVFSRWKLQSPSIIQGDYQEQLRKLYVDILAQGTAYREAVELGIEEAKEGSRVAHDIVYFLDQLVTGATPSEEVAELLEDLSDKTRELCQTTQKLRDKFLGTRGALLQVSKDSLPRVESEIASDKARYETMRHQAIRKAQKSLWAAVGSVLLVPVAPILAIGALAGGGAAISLYDDADSYKERVAEAENALNILNHLGTGLDTAVGIVGKHVDFWAKLHDGIEAALNDQSGLIRNGGLPKIAMVKKHRSSWLELEARFDSYGSLALASRQILEINAA
ncbi:hypothetical protein FRB96_003042 [Tulasnella sp. 330]|nr:hypothetical protein FRB96_003042 [Tulasnella sp. 330]KAG8876808.1 hypothetical protein FRB98_007021 [Tulasnella sp. 332]